MISFSVSESYKKINKHELFFDSMSLPYYILNTNVDIEKMHTAETVAESCFPNAASSVVSMYGSEKNIKSVEELLSYEFTQKTNSSVTLCPSRLNLLEYVQWCVSELESNEKTFTSFDGTQKSPSFVEVPLVPVKYFYARLLSRLKAGETYSLRKSAFLVPYIDGLYLSHVPGSTSRSSTAAVSVITDYDSFSALFNGAFRAHLNAYLTTINGVSAYIQRGNFYGHEMQKYKTIRDEYLKGIKEFFK